MIVKKLIGAKLAGQHTQVSRLKKAIRRLASFFEKEKPMATRISVPIGSYRGLIEGLARETGSKISMITLTGQKLFLFSTRDWLVLSGQVRENCPEERSIILLPNISRYNLIRFARCPLPKIDNLTTIETQGGRLKGDKEVR